MHPRKWKWQVCYVLSNGKTVTHIFGSEEHATDHMKGVFAGKHLLREFDHGEKYTVYPASLIIEVKVECFEDKQNRHYTGPSWNV